MLTDERVNKELGQYLLLVFKWLKHQLKTEELNYHYYLFSQHNFCSQDSQNNWLITFFLDPIFYSKVETLFACIAIIMLVWLLLLINLSVSMVKRCIL